MGWTAENLAKIHRERPDIGATRAFNLDLGQLTRRVIRQQLKPSDVYRRGLDDDLAALDPADPDYQDLTIKLSEAREFEDAQAELADELKDLFSQSSDL